MAYICVQWEKVCLFESITAFVNRLTVYNGPRSPFKSEMQLLWDCLYALQSQRWSIEVTSAETRVNWLLADSIRRCKTVLTLQSARCPQAQSRSSKCRMKFIESDNVGLNFAITDGRHVSTSSHSPKMKPELPRSDLRRWVPTHVPTSSILGGAEPSVMMIHSAFILSNNWSMTLNISGVKQV